jgi:hypothetical protein
MRSNALPPTQTLLPPIVSDLCDGFSVHVDLCATGIGRDRQLPRTGCRMRLKSSP